MLSDTDLASPSQSTFPDRHFTQRGLLFEARIDRSPSHLWYRAAAVQLSAFATGHIVGMKIPKCYCASAGAADEETIKKHIESQKWDDDDQVFNITCVRLRSSGARQKWDDDDQVFNITAPT